MKLTTKQRHWLLGGALLLTVAAVAATGESSDPDGAIVEAKQARGIRNPEHRGTDAELATNHALAKLHRQVLPERPSDIFAIKTWDARPSQVAAAKPVAPPLPYMYVGKLEEQGKALVIVLTKQDRNYTVREGDILDGNYRVDEVREPMMVLTYLPLNIKQTIQIGESN